MCIGSETVDEHAEALRRKDEDEREQLIEQIWAKLTESNPACSCCNGDDEYQDRVNEIGAMIDGRRWVRNFDKNLPAYRRYETVPGDRRA